MSKTQSSRQVLALAALLVMSASASAAEYRIEPIRSPTNDGFVHPTSIAANGLVAGQVYASTNYCFKYLDGTFTTLPLPPNTLRCESAVTDLKGNITMTVVPSDKPTTTRVVELTSKGKFLNLSGLSADGNTVYASMNGRMVGTSLAANGEPQAYLFNRTGAGVNVGTLTGMTRSWLRGINAKGWAVGYGQSVTSPALRAFRYKDGKITWLDNLAEGGSSFATSINAGGTAVGSSESTAADTWSYRAVTWQGKSAPVSLGTVFNQFTFGNAINSYGVVVGRFGFNSAGMRVRNGVATDLTSLILPEQMPQWSMVGAAVAINDAGLITGVASSYNGDTYDAYLLRPLP